MQVLSHAATPPAVPPARGHSSFARRQYASPRIEPTVVNCAAAGSLNTNPGRRWPCRFATHAAPGFPPSGAPPLVSTATTTRVAPPPAGDAVLAQRPVEGQHAVFDVEVVIWMLEHSVDVDLVLILDIGGEFDDAALGHERSYRLSHWRRPEPGRGAAFRLASSVCARRC